MFQGVTVPEGSLLHLRYGAANVDADEFDGLLDFRVHRPTPVRPLMAPDEAAFLRWVKQHGRADVVRILEDCVEESLDIDRLCRETGMSKFHFIRSFKEAYGISPKRYWTSTRLLAAMDAARQTSEPLEDIAQRLGYADRSSFARAFRRHIGQPPAQYLREQPRLH